MDQFDLENALRGLDFPAPRNKLIAKALENRASADVIARLREVPETADFLTPEDVRKSFGIDVPDVRQPHDWE
ncbi:MAG TPA: DUF2795 domain-containing protein [Vicinamibacterales bacterium]|nr:DUF2795 domain-containing protein [Vicinamibacterales bacterium]